MFLLLTWNKIKSLIRRKLLSFLTPAFVQSNKSFVATPQTRCHSFASVDPGQPWEHDMFLSESFCSVVLILYVILKTNIKICHKIIGHGGHCIKTPKNTSWRSTATCLSARFMTPSRELTRVEPEMILIQEEEVNVMKVYIEVTRRGGRCHQRLYNHQLRPHELHRKNHSQSSASIPVQMCWK